MRNARTITYLPAPEPKSRFCLLWKNSSSLVAGPALPYHSPHNPHKRIIENTGLPGLFLLFYTSHFPSIAEKSKEHRQAKGREKNSILSSPLQQALKSFDIWLVFLREVISSFQKKSFRSKWHSAVIRGKLVFIRAVIIQHGGREAGNLCNLSQIWASE